MFNLIILICLLLITFVYNGYIIYKHKTIPSSFSETAYLLGENKNYFFTLYCLMIGFATLPQLFEITNNGFGFIPFIFIICLSFAGLTPNYRSDFQDKIHNISAYISFAAFILFMFIYVNHWLILGYLLICSILVCLRKQSWTYIFEIISILFLNFWLIYKNGVS